MAACGGSGGGDSGTGTGTGSGSGTGSGTGAGTGTGTGTGTASVITAFPLRAAYKSYLINGYAQTFTVSGDCAGTAFQRSAKPVAATFQGAAALAVVTESNFSLSNCSAPVTGFASVQYFDADYQALGAVPGFAKYEPPLALPNLVRVGDGALLGTELLYTDDTLSTQTGRIVVSYSVLADTATTALTRFTQQAYDVSGQLLSTQTTTYRLGFDGSFAITSLDLRQSNGLHLLLMPS